MVQNLRYNFILYVNKNKWIMCVQEKIELSSMSQRPRLSSTKIPVDLFLASKKKQQ